MRFMIIVKATPASEAGVLPQPEVFEAMGKYHQALSAAGVLLDAAGLQPSTKGWRVEYRGEHRTVVDGPFAETKELIAGYTLIDVKSEAEAREWALKFPNPAAEGGAAQIELRRVYELEDFEPAQGLEIFKHVPSKR